MYENVKLFQRIPTFNVNNFTTEIKNSNTFVGFCYVKIKLEKKNNNNNLENSQTRKVTTVRSVVKNYHRFSFLYMYILMSWSSTWDVNERSIL